MNADELNFLISKLNPNELLELERLLTVGVLWTPLPGPQTLAYENKADIIGYGGSAGGGKSDLAIGLALTEHKVSAIFRREATQLQGILERIQDILGSREGYNGQDRIWRLPKKRRIEFGSAPHVGDESRYQGRPKDLLVIDEATSFLESQVRFLMGWVRTTDTKQRCRTLLTFNPPTNADGQWVLKFFAPWLDKGHKNPAAPGELRWFATLDGEDVEVETSKEFKHRDELIKPQSRTFIPSKITDNPYLLGTGYMAQLQSLPEPLRSQMLHGDFTAGMEDDAYQVIPSDWVDAAMERWEPCNLNNYYTMDSMGVDVARGGRDETVISCRHDNWFAPLITHSGSASPDGPTVAAHIIAARRDQAPVHIDVVGWGSSPFDFLVQNGIQAIAVNNASKSSGLAISGGLKLSNRRAEVWWRLREALDPMSHKPIALPKDSGLRADLCAPTWKLTPQGICIESKDEIIARLGRSPDRGDAVTLANINTQKIDIAKMKPVFAMGGGVPMSNIEGYDPRDTLRGH